MAKFCVSCGAELKPSQTKCDYCGRVIKSKNVFSSRIDDENVNDYTKNSDNYNSRNNRGSSYRTSSTTTITKSPTVAFILAATFGWCGIHNFYYGQITNGIVKVLLNFFTFGIFSSVIWAWAIIEGILMLSGVIKSK